MLSAEGFPPLYLSLFLSLPLTHALRYLSLYLYSANRARPRCMRADAAAGANRCSRMECAIAYWHLGANTRHQVSPRRPPFGARVRKVRGSADEATRCDVLRSHTRCSFINFACFAYVFTPRIRLEICPIVKIVLVTFVKLQVRFTLLDNKFPYSRSLDLFFFL